MNVRAQFGKLMLVLALSLSLGAHWPILQSVAWTSMIVRFAWSGTFSEALVKTFDGQHPCALCRMVSDGKKSEQEKQQPLLKIQKFDPFLETPVRFFFSVFAPEYPDAANESGIQRTERPPFPPPRIS